MNRKYESEEIFMTNNTLKELENNATGWEYADLTKLAKNYGGPENLITSIYTEAYKDAVMDIAKLFYIPIAVLSTAFLWRKSKEEISRLVNKNVKLKSEKYLEKIKAELNGKYPKEVIKEGNLLKVDFSDDTVAE
jgi:hypothetical protein